MFTPGKIWILLLGVLVLSTALTAYCWYSSPVQSLNPSINASGNTPPGLDLAFRKKMISTLMAEYKKTKTDLMELKSDKNSLLVRLNDDKEGNGVIDYQTGDNTTVIREQYRNANISEISYNTNRDNRITVIEYYSAESRYPDIRKLDTNGDGFIDMMEEDKNHDGIIDTNELQVNMEGMFIPFSTFSVIIM